MNHTIYTSNFKNKTKPYNNDTKAKKRNTNINTISNKKS